MARSAGGGARSHRVLSDAPLPPSGYSPLRGEKPQATSLQHAAPRSAVDSGKREAGGGKRVTGSGNRRTGNGQPQKEEPGDTSASMPPRRTSSRVSRLRWSGWIRRPDQIRVRPNPVWPAASAPNHLRSPRNTFTHCWTTSFLRGAMLPDSGAAWGLAALKKSRNRGIVEAVSDHAISKLAGGRPRKTYEAGRTCAAEGCSTRLSSYNKNEHCWTHFQPVPKPARIPADN